ncbi:MAG: PmbA/TldA family metallopeptidase, partial [Elusimicrobiota bacterium]
MIQAPAEAYAKALAGADYGEAFIEETSWTSASLEDGRVQDVSAGSDRGLGLRLLRRHGAAVETFFGSGPDVGPEAAARLRADLLPPASGPAPRGGPPPPRGGGARAGPAPRARRPPGGPRKHRRGPGS